TYSKHKSMIPIIPGSEITLPERPRHSDLCHFLTVSTDSKFGLSSQNFATYHYGRFPADAANPKIVKDFSYVGFFDCNQLIHTRIRDQIVHMIGLFRLNLRQI